MEVTGERTLWEGKYIRTSMILYKDRSGTAREWEAVSRLNCRGIVIVVPITKNNEIILIRQFRPVLNSYAIELPAGLIDEGEDAISAGKRELIEETSYCSDNFKMLTVGVMSTGVERDKWNIVVAQDAEEASEDLQRAHQADENEDIETIVVPVDNVYETLDSYAGKGDEIDLRIYGLLEMARRKIPGF